jgi:hypothetical protein
VTFVLTGSVIVGPASPIPFENIDPALTNEIPQREAPTESEKSADIATLRVFVPALAPWRRYR